MIGNTPAQAGKTRQMHCAENHTQKHPCSRREDARSIVKVLFMRETPLLTQGRRISVLTQTGHVGNTPAHAGKTPNCPGPSKAPWKHPCSRREDRTMLIPKSYPLETPLLTQGRPLPDSAELVGIGNTPAHAGKTITNRMGMSEKQKHPCSRRED